MQPHYSQTGSQTAAAVQIIDAPTLSWSGGEIEGLAGRAEQMRLHYSAAAAIAAGVAAEAGKRNTSTLFWCHVWAKGSQSERGKTDADTSFPSQSEQRGGGGEAGEKVEAPLFFSLSDSGRLRRPVYLHLLRSTERKGDLREHEAEREGGKKKKGKKMRLNTQEQRRGRIICPEFIGNKNKKFK